MTTFKRSSLLII